MNKLEPVRLSEYMPYPFNIPEIKLDFVIVDEYVSLIAIMRVVPLSKLNEPLILQGKNLELQELCIDDVEVVNEEFHLTRSNLTIYKSPLAPFELKIITKFNPFNNLSLEGLYLSKSILTTQCEAEGFRRICFHPDRPDVLSKYVVRIEANIERYPILLSNGNLIKSCIVQSDPSRHEVLWEDPFPKPSYLFALVAGKLKKCTDKFMTSSGREVSINLYVESGDENYTYHAIQSLKKAMIWDESKYGFEYDLNEYNIVAVRHFNMGAMENKGLNIFNSKLVLADSVTATDDELLRIESVIAHEYFHNWTGNRITCRDWFQLSLKEGLTVYRDQSFTSDLHSESTKRIEDVSFLRNYQFSEDSGPTSHAVKPNQYLSIDNFYTTTIYEKGAEIVRMLSTLLNEEGFFRGIALYAKRFDGCAITTEEFLKTIIEGACEIKSKISFDINQFSNWYYQPGTPEVSISREWDPKLGKLTLDVTQNIVSKDTILDKKPLVIPLLIAVITSDKKVNQEELLIIDQPKQKFILENLPNNKEMPVPSLFRGFSAPVKWKSDFSQDELFDLFRFDNDPFSKWDSGQSLLRLALLSRASNNPDIQLERKLVKTFSDLIMVSFDVGLEDLLILLCLPGLPELELAQEEADPISLYKARMFLASLFGETLREPLRSLLVKTEAECRLKWPYGNASRKFRKLAWYLLALGGDIEVRSEALEGVKGNSMTLARAGLNALKPINCPERKMAMQTFYNLWKDRPVILDTWFSLEASIPRDNGLNRARELLEHPRFDYMAPNSIRAVLGGFSANTKAFHSVDGSGYVFMADQIIEIDKRNPITASRIAKVFCRWQSYTEIYRIAMHNALIRLSNSKLSSNTSEIVDQILSV